MPRLTHWPPLRTRVYRSSLLLRAARSSWTGATPRSVLLRTLRGEGEVKCWESARGCGSG
eukprot:1929518-Prymnesium_polylepis.1